MEVSCNKPSPERYVIEGEVIHIYLDHFIAVCGSWYLARDTMKLRIKAQH